MGNKLPLKSEKTILSIENILFEEGLIYYLPTHIAFNTPIKLINILKLTIGDFLENVEPEYQLFNDSFFKENFFIFINKRAHSELLFIIPGTEKPLYRNYLSSKYSYLYKKGKIPQINAHVFRYSFYYKEYKRTGSMSYVQKKYFDSTNYSIKSLYQMLSIPQPKKTSGKIDKNQLLVNINTITEKLLFLEKELQADNLSLSEQVNLSARINNILVELENPTK